MLKLPKVYEILYYRYSIDVLDRISELHQRYIKGILNGYERQEHDQ